MWWTLALLAGCYDGNERGTRYDDTARWPDTGRTTYDTWRSLDTDTAAPPVVEVEDAAQRVLEALSILGGSEGVTWSADRVDLPGDAVLVTPGQPGAADLGLHGAAACVGDGCLPEIGLAACPTGTCSPGTRCRDVGPAHPDPADAAVYGCLGDADLAWNSLYDVVVTATRSVDVASARPPTGRFLVALRSAITSLHLRGRTLTVRVLLGADPLSPPDVEGVAEALRRDLPPDSGVDVVVGAWGTPTGWNHARLVVVDSGALLVGGRDLDADAALGAHPTTDLSLLAEGLAATTATRFLDRAWGAVCDPPAEVTTRAVALPAGVGCPAVTPIVPPASGGRDVIAAGRLGALGEDAGDLAQLAAIRAATSELVLLQPALPSDPADPATLEIVYALARGVHVYALVSDVAAVDDGPDGARPPALAPGEAAAAIEAAARGAPGVFAPSEDVHAIVCERLHLAPIRFGTDATWPDDSGYSVHTPAIVVDAALAYVGGQTLAEAEHAAFGLWIDDAPWTARFMSAIWSPLWEGSRAGAVSGEGACTF